MVGHRRRGGAGAFCAVGERVDLGAVEARKNSTTCGTHSVELMHADHVPEENSPSPHRRPSSQPRLTVTWPKLWGRPRAPA